VIGLLVFWGNDAQLLKRALLWVVFWSGMIAFYGLLNVEFQLQNALIAFVTWIGIIVVLIIPIRNIGSPWLKQKLERLAWKVLLVEAVWGIVQGIYGYLQTGTFDLATGDYVEGTIHPSLAPELTYSNVMFAINIALLLLFLLPVVRYQRNLKNMVIYSLGVLAFVMASVVHVILFLIASSTIGAFLVWGRRPRLSRLALATATFGSVLFLAWTLLPRNLSTAQAFAFQIIRGEVPKSVSVIVSFKEMPQDYWYLPLVGLGPGQYASRAGLISTGLYFGGLDNPRQIPFLPNKLTESQAKYLLPLWAWHESVRYFGSTQKPFFSWLAVYTEWGLIGWLIVAIVLVRVWKSLQRLTQTYDVEKWVLTTTMFLIFLLGFQENNWEVPQAWFSGLMFLKVLYGVAMKDER
jgi:hypothetical protein